MAFREHSPLPVINGGTGATTLTGVVTGNGTAAFTASAVTQHDVLVGGASNAITSVAPSATLGFPFISAGTSADPSFGNYVNVPTSTATSTGTYQINGFPVLQTFGTDNVAVGKQAGNFSLTGTDNVFVGYQSGLATTTAADNVFIGSKAGTATTTGGSNIFVGANAGAANIAGIASVFIGPNAGQNCTAGNNIFIGNAAGQDTVGGTDNIFVGSSCGTTNVSGSQNTLIGFASGYFNTVSNNTFVGFEAGAQNSTGTPNCFFGTQSGYSNTSGSNNSFYGYQSGMNITTGGHNVLVGATAGTSYTGAESNNVMIAHNGVVSESNTLRIGSGTGTGTEQFTTAYISGIKGVNVGSTATVVTNTGSSDQLGTATITAGAGIVITPTANTITITNSGSAASTTYVNSSPYTVLTTDHIILMDTNLFASPMTVNLPNSATDGQSWTIKDWSGAASSFNITVTTVGGSVTIDGSTTVVMAVNYESITVAWSVSRGTYSIVAEADAPANVSLNGDTGSASGASVSIKAGVSTQNSGSSVSFSGSGSTLTLNVTDGNTNTIIGFQSGNAAISGIDNVAIGSTALLGLTSGYRNIAIGDSTLSNIQSDFQNIAVGYQSLQGFNGGSQNISIRTVAGSLLATGAMNILIGDTAGHNYTAAESGNILLNSEGVAAENNTLRIGFATGTGGQDINAAYICGINGITVTGTAVLVSSSDKLGVAVSSRRFKDNIQDMGDVSSSLMSLRPVTFTYAIGEDTTSIQPGLIAEEVHEVMPSLVVYDKEGLPQTVKYHELPSLLLNELQKSNKMIEMLTKRIEYLERKG